MIKPGTGTLLIAEPFLKDPNFIRTVVLICRHEDAEGTFGFVVNKLFHQTLDQLIPELAGYPLPIFTGGPVQMDTLHYLHQYPDLLPESQEIADGIYWGGNFETLKSLIAANEIDTEKIKFFLGYSGWEKGQLDNEMDVKSWLTTGSNEKLIFQTPMEEIWKECLRTLGGKFEMMINFPIDPQLN
ncbi:MAG: YqgE/AlgH family protein [Ferruginibacter sp.]